MRLQDGRYISYPQVKEDGTPDANKSVFVTEGTDVRITDTINGDTHTYGNHFVGHRLLKKFEFTSQDEMHKFVSANSHKLATYEEKRKLQDGRNENLPQDWVAREQKHYSSIVEDGDEWAFGKAKESDCASKTDKLLEDGRSTSGVRRIIRKTLKDIRLAGVDKMLNERFESVKRKRVWSEDGAELDIDRIMTGDPQHWVNTKRNGKKRVIKIAVNGSMSWNNGSGAFAKNVALAYVTAEALENLGYGVEIVTLMSSWCLTNDLGQDENAMVFDLKKSSEPVDVERVGSIGLPSLLRYYTFIARDFIFRQDNGNCRKTSDEMKGFLGIDILVENSWSMGGTVGQAQRITRAIDEAIKQ